MTKFHIRWSLLREGDGQLYQQIKIRWYRIAEIQAERRKHVQEKYREKKRRSMDIQFPATCTPDRQLDTC